MDKDRAIKVVNEFLDAKHVSDEDTRNITAEFVYSHYGLKSDTEISDLDIKIMADKFLKIQKSMPEGVTYNFNRSLF